MGVSGPQTILIRRRPWRRLRLIIRRPPGVRILARKPCFLALFILLFRLG